MAFRTTPSLGPDVDQVFNGLPYWDVATSITDVSPRLGNPELGSDGRQYVFVRASAAIASGTGNGTQVAVNFGNGTAATGSGGFYAPPGVAVPNGAYFYAREGVIA